MSSPRLTRLIVAMFAALAMTVLVNARPAFSQDADSLSADVGAGGGPDANWAPAAPAIDEDAATADKVLELPRVVCSKDGAPVACDDATADTDDDGTQAVNAPSSTAPPNRDDDSADTADAAVPNQDWGTLDDYENEETYAVPYAVYPYPIAVAAVPTNRGPSPLPTSGFVPSTPLTQAALPPLNPGPWMLRPSMSTFNHPAGNPMMGMSMSHPFAFHR